MEVLTVREVLRTLEGLDGDPRIVHRAALDQPVSWAHVVAGTEIEGLLDGGELVLTTGAGWPSDGTKLERLCRVLVESEPAAIVFELGGEFPQLPDELRLAAARSRVPLIVLYRRIRFVQVTQYVHRSILARQKSELEARAQIHDLFTELSLNRSPLDHT